MTHATDTFKCNVQRDQCVMSTEDCPLAQVHSPEGNGFNMCQWMQGDHRKAEQAASVHPLLRAGQPIVPHGLAKAQIEAFSAVCDTIFPSLPGNYEELASVKGLGGEHTELLPKHQRQLLEDYYRLSASDLNVPLEAVGHMTKLFKRSQARLVHLVLWMLTTRLGTLILGGKHAFTSSFPFIFHFSGLPEHKRHAILLALSNSDFYFKQEIFRFFKCFVCWSILTKLDGFGHNPILDAIEYRVDEEEDIIEVRDMPSDIKGTTKEDTSKETIASLLSQRVVDAKEAREHLGAELARLGVAQCVDVSRLEALRRPRREGRRCTKVGLRCDVVIAGSGPGGAVVAAKLAREGYSVVILEKGVYFPVGTYSQLEGPSMYAMYEEGGCLVTDDSRMILLAGSTVGGGSTINWCASFRTPCHVRSEWAQSLQLDLFSSPTYDHAMDAVCSRLGVQSDVAHENFPNSVLRAGCCHLGFHVDTIPRNCPPDHQCGSCGLGCKQAKKQGAMLTWLEDAAQAGAVLISSCQAEEVLMWSNEKRPRVAGIVASVVGADVEVYVEADVVVSACGALRTPGLLRQSGLRNAAIGRNLHIHPVQLVWAYFAEGSGPAGVCYRGGIMTAFSNVAANWDTSGYGALIQCGAAQPGVMALCTPWLSGLDYKERLRKFARTAFFIVLTRDQGGGQASIDVDGRLCINYKLADVDMENLRQGAEQALRIMKAAGASQMGTFNNDGEIYNANVAGSDDEDAFKAFLKRVRDRSFQKLSTITVSAHQMGTCRMGIRPSASAVRPNGETWEVEGLFVADSSVFPTATGVNPMITVQSIAYCIADSILAHLHSKRQENIATFLMKKTQ